MQFDLDRQNLLIQEVKQDNALTIPTLNVNNLSYSYFFENYIFKNIPCIIKNITQTWQANQLWIKNGQLDLDYLDKQYGNCDTLVYNCSEKYFNSQKCENWKLSKYLNYWKNRTDNDPLYYLKDCHLKKQNQQDNFYEVPIYFASDWLNEYCTKFGYDDYQFVYIGPKGTWTPFHADVFGSYSWSANLYGSKKWILFPPGEENYLKDNFNNLPYDISKISHTRKCIEIIQNAGEAIFVPSCWYHQVWNLEDTISINHNWINACNIHIVFRELQENLVAIKKEIADCSDMENFQEHCQIMLNAQFGMNYEKFYEFIDCITKRRLDMLTNISKRNLYNKHTIGVNQIKFDLKKLENILTELLSCDTFKDKYKINIENILNELKQV